MYQRFFKRFFDCSCSLAAIIVLSPVLLIAAILVRVKLGSPVVFKQQRPGKDEKIFNIYKFRTMTDERDENGKLLPDCERLTSFGRFLRKTSIDELPELFCILKGDMSVVGPRPLLVEYLPYYTQREKMRHTVRPGLSGLAQVNGRNFLSWDERLELDVKYVENISFKTDCMIILKTLTSFFGSDEVAEDTNKSEGNFATIRSAEKVIK